MRIGEYWFDAYSDPNALPRPPRRTRQPRRTPPTRSTTRRSTSWAGRTTAWIASTTRWSSFLTLADFYEAQKAEQSGDEESGGDLREEALQYVADLAGGRELAGGGLAGAQALLRQARRARPYEADIYRRLGNIYFDQTKHTAAIEAYQLVLQKDPLATDAPAGPAEDRPGATSATAS